MIKAAERTNKITESIFSTISRLANEHKAVNLGQGFPDFNGPEFIMKKAYESMLEGKNQYAPANGIYSLRKIISEITKKYYALDYSTDEILISTGATEALYATMMALLNPGDEVIIFEPYYDGYPSDVMLAGGIPKYVTLKKPDFTFDAEELEKAVTDKTKMIIINTPHNPTGKVFTKEELQKIADIAIKNDLLVVSDEVYEFLLFDDAEHIPLASLDGMRDRTITISSTGKTFGMTGWKIGFIKAKKYYTDAILKIRQWSTFAVNTPGQHAMTYGFEQFEDYLPEFKKLYSDKRNFVYEELLKSKFKPYKPYGTYFLMVDVPAEFTSDVDASTRLITDYGVALIPPSVFYEKSDEGKKLLRICFAKTDDTLTKGMKILQSI